MFFQITLIAELLASALAVAVLGWALETVPVPALRARAVLLVAVLAWGIGLVAGFASRCAIPF